MVGALNFLPIFLIGLTSAQCPTECSPCKVFNAGEMCGPTGNQINCGGSWNLLDPNPNPRCTQIIGGEKVNVCLYRREEDGTEFCFCDPGNSEYEPCTKFKGGDCYNYTAVASNSRTSLTHNDVASCNKYCLENNDRLLNFFFELGSSPSLNGHECDCSQTAPDPDLKVEDKWCDIDCPGRNELKCGGPNAGTRYVTIWPTLIATDGNCYSYTPPFPSSVKTLVDNDLQKCDSENKIHNSGFAFSGLGPSSTNNGEECYAINSLPPIAQLVYPYYCYGSPCPGNNAQKCGYYQTWTTEKFINVWRRLL